jgi:hypothetical protein
MNEELENVLNSDTPKNQGENNVEIESESSVVGVIFTVIAWLNMVAGLFLLMVEKIESYDQDYTFGLTLIGSSLFLNAVASCLQYLAKISSRMGRIMKALEK